MLDLGTLPLGLLERLVVGHFHHDGGDPAPEMLAQFRGGGLGILDRVVEQRRADDRRLGDAALAPEDVGERDRVVDVGRGLEVLAPLVAMLQSGELQRLEHRSDGFLHPDRLHWRRESACAEEEPP